MSVSELLDDELKPWCNIRVNSLKADGGITYPQHTFSPTTTPQSISSSQNGIFLLPQATATLTINLPAPSAGNSFTVYLTGVPDGTNTVTFHSTGTNMSGHRCGVAAGIVATSFSGVTNIILGATAANAKVGDYVSFVSTGTTYLVEAWSSGTADAWSTS